MPIPKSHLPQEDDPTGTIAPFESPKPVVAPAKPPAPAPIVPPPPPPRTVAIVSTPAEVNWYFKRRTDWFPQDRVAYDDLRKMGFGGIMSESQDPNLAAELSRDQANGFRTGVWYPPPTGITPEAACAETVAAVQQGHVDALALDVEFVGKGDPGSPGWNWSQAYAACVRAHLPQMPLAVTPMPGQTDFNYEAYTKDGAVVWVQCYGSSTAQLFDPVQMVGIVNRRGVPYDHIGALLAPSQLPTAGNALRALGIRNIAVYGTDGMSPEVVSQTAPFPTDNATPFATSQTAPSPDAAPRSSKASFPSGTQNPSLATADTLVTMRFTDGSSYTLPLDAPDYSEDPEADAISADSVDQFEFSVDASATADNESESEMISVGLKTFAE